MKQQTLIARAALAAILAASISGCLVVKIPSDEEQEAMLQRFQPLVDGAARSVDLALAGVPRIWNFTVTQSVAPAAMREAEMDMDAAVNEFISLTIREHNRGLSPSQIQKKLAPVLARKGIVAGSVLAAGPQPRDVALSGIYKHRSGFCARFHTSEVQIASSYGMD